MAFRSRAFSSQGTAVYIGADTTGTAVTVTGITAANPAVITTTAPHDLMEGDIGTFAAVGGMTEINGLTGIVQDPASTTFEAFELDSSTFTTYTSGGTFTPTVDWLKACEIRTASFTGGQSAEIDVTTICSTAMEFLTGLQDFGEASLEVNFVPGDPAIKAFLDAAADGQPRWFKIVMPSGQGTLVFQATVRQISFAFGVNQAWQGTFSLRIKGEVEFVGVEPLPAAA